MEASSLTLGVLVPGGEAGKLIGKQGSGLKQIREMSQCKLQMGNNQDSKGNKRCDISGPTVEHMASAIHAIGTRLFDKVGPQERVTLFVAFPNDYVGGVIGKGGQNLKDIYNQTGIEVKMPKDAISDEGDRVGQLLGIPNQLGAAIRIALNAVAGNSAPAMNESYNDYGRSHGSMQGMQQAINSWRPQHAGNSAIGKGHSGPSMARPMASLTQVKPASGAHGEMQIHMVIPPKFIGCILGKEGAQIKQLLTETGCTHLAVSKKEPFGDSDRRVIMVGGFDECARAQQAVWQIYSDNAQQAGAEASLTCIMMVPIDKAGAVIGKEGSNLKQIREKFSLKASLAKEHVEGFRPCTLSGQLEMVLEAERQILDQISDGGSGPAPSGPGNGLKRPFEAAVVPATPYVDAYVPADPEAKRQKSSAQEQYTKLLVPSAKAGAIIGKQGSTLKEIRESTGARVEVLAAAQAPEFAQMRVVILKGDFDPRQAALVKVLSTAFEKDQEAAQLKMMVPQNFAGALIGKAGSNLKAIRENSAINVQVHKEQMNGERMVEGNGPLDAILNAATMVMGSCEGVLAPNS